MSKIIAVWGSPGSGKSLFCCTLAKALTRGKEKAIIISGDRNAPMLPVWLPEEIIGTDMSVGQVLTSAELNSAVLASHVTVLRSYPFIGLAGYAASENPLSYPETPYEQYKLLYDTAAQLVEYVIVDCTSNLVDLFNPAAIERSDLAVCVLTPDPKGTAYFQAQKPLLSGPRFRLEEHIVLAGQARPFHAIDEMRHVVGRLEGLLPYNKEVELSGAEGRMFDAQNCCGKKYHDSLRCVMSRIRSEEEPAMAAPVEARVRTGRGRRGLLLGRRKRTSGQDAPGNEEGADDGQ